MRTQEQGNSMYWLYRCIDRWPSGGGEGIEGIFPILERHRDEVDFTRQDEAAGDTIFHTAVKKGLSLPNCEDRPQNNPLDPYHKPAFIRGKCDLPAVVGAFIRAGAPFDIQNKEGKTVIDLIEDAIALRKDLAVLEEIMSLFTTVRPDLLPPPMRSSATRPTHWLNEMPTCVLTQLGDSMTFFLPAASSTELTSRPAMPNRIRLLGTELTPGACTQLDGTIGLIAIAFHYANKWFKWRSAHRTLPVEESKAQNTLEASP